jgi:DNA-binding Xre family transcriptional regulator
MVGISFAPAGNDPLRMSVSLAEWARRTENEMSASQIIEHLMAAIRDAESRGVTRYQLSQRTGIPQSTLSRLMNGQRESLKVETVETLCRELGFELVMRRTKKEGK